ncbi:FKBP-type peptidyl-prolyl cis-trans isomerase [Allosphingosinicella sp.]|jgi:hypothetical protein|uniref:FKBP-type peptidyl-prolyl cis-trans isomerase n=1 Tax=Allosphingosinicella sp. TaxID=2823234 RepID=UPI002F027764
MSVTAVPIRPLKKGSMVKLWIGLLLLAALAAALAWWTTGGLYFTRTASGLEYQVVTSGEGPNATENDIASINFEGRLEDGTVIGTNRGQAPVDIPVGGGIPGTEGIVEALQLMNKGSVYRLRLPPHLNPAAQGAPGVAADSTVEFDVTLVDLRAMSAEERQQLELMRMMQQGGGPGGPGTAGPGGPPVPQPAPPAPQPSAPKGDRPR